MSRGEKQQQQESYAEQLDIPRVTISEAMDQLAMSWKYKQFRGVWCLIGEAGLGKSQVVHQLAKENNARVCDVRTAQFGALSAGIPSIKGKEDDFFKIKVPDNFPKPGEKTIMLFDEVNQGEQSALAMFFSLLEDRCMYGYTLPEETLVVAAMNPDTKNYSVSRVEGNAAFRRRMKMIYITPAYKGWLAHAKTDKFHSSDIGCSVIGKEGSPCHPSVLNFIKAAPRILDNQTARENGKQYMCPATVQTVSLDAYVMEAEGTPLHGEVAQIKFGSSIGMTTATQLVAYMENSDILIDPMAVLTNLKSVKGKITRLVNKGQTEPLIELGLNVQKALYAEQPDVTVAGTNYVDFLSVLPADTIQAILSQTKKVARDNDALDYNKELAYEMRGNDAWQAIHQRMEEGHQNVENDLA
jgi:hypothetical protein